MAKKPISRAKRQNQKLRKVSQKAKRDDFGREFLKLKGSVDPSADLEILSADFDRRLASFKTTGIRDRVEAVMAAKGRAKRRSKAGDSF